MAQKRFVQRTIAKDHTWVPISVERLTDWHLEFWEKSIQPSIESLGPNLRIDAHWNWRTITSISRLAHVLLQRPEAFALVYGDERMRDYNVVCGLIQLARSYDFLPNKGTDPNRVSGGYLWMCATAPTQALVTHIREEKIPKRLGQLCIDIAVTASYLDGYEGRICLHADQKAPLRSDGSDYLTDFYSSAPVNMKRLPQDIPISHLRRIWAPNDGRYFYFDEDGAAKFSEQFDTYRER